MTAAQTGGGQFPLTNDHYQMMQGVLDIVGRVLPIMEKCRDCGLPVDTEMQALKDRAEFAAAVKRNFFPELP